MEGGLKGISMVSQIENLYAIEVAKLARPGRRKAPPYPGIVK
jgi:hypothetical protein